VLTGCAVFLGHQLPARDYADLDNPRKGVHLSYSLNFHGAEEEYMNEVDAKVFGGKVRDVLATAGFLTELDESPAKTTLHLQLLLEKNTPRWGVASFLLSFFTLTIIPGYAQENYTLKADVTKNGAEVRKYEYHERLNYWTHVFLVFYPIPNIEEIENRLVKKMTITLLHDMQKDGFMDAP
jgi:hypothetical protein